MDLVGREWNWETGRMASRTEVKMERQTAGHIQDEEDWLEKEGLGRRPARVWKLSAYAPRLPQH